MKIRWPVVILTFTLCIHSRLTFVFEVIKATDAQYGFIFFLADTNNGNNYLLRYRKDVHITCSFCTSEGKKRL